MKKRAAAIVPVSKTQSKPRLTWETIPSLWPNQVAALKRIDEYLLSSSSGSALVQMPTGSGKTGIIAVSARLTAADGKVSIILSPSKALAEQLLDDVSSTLWRRLTVASPWSDVTATTLLRTNESDIRTALAAASSSAQILVGTMQALTDIRASDPVLCSALASAASVVYVDEGHREPAPQWSQSVQSLGARMVLFSATPYRNDYRVFNVDTTYISYESFQSAISDGRIRDVTFEAIDAGTNSPAEFAIAAAQRFVEMERDGIVLPEAKAILRFARRGDIENAIVALRQSGDAIDLGFVGVHERFDGSDPQMLKSIPDLRKRSERLFLHQFKLSEGIDEPRCSVLFLHSNFGNERQLVQQIGRCIRRVKPRSKSVEPNAVVVHVPGVEIETTWDAYREYDKQCEKTGRPPIFSVAEYSRMVQEVGLLLHYADRRFRVALEPEINGARSEDEDEERLKSEVRLVQDVIVPRKCTVYEGADDPWDIEDVAHIVEALLDKTDRRVIASAKPFPGQIPDMYVIVSHELSPSRYFKRYALVENNYAVTVLYKRGKRLFLFDANRLALSDRNLVKPEDLMRLLPATASTTVKMMAARNTDISAFAVRSREFTASSIADTAPSLIDFLSIISRTRGTTFVGGEHVGRYLGIFRGRVSDARAAEIPLPDYAEWCNGLTLEFDSNAKSNEVFSRYAQPMLPPSDPEPRNILLDLAQTGMTFADPLRQETLFIDDFCADIVPNASGKHDKCPWSFDITVVPNDDSSKRQSVTIYFRHENKRFYLEAPSLARFVSDNSERVTVIEALNRSQSFRVVIGDGNEAYGYRHFYNISPSKTGMLNVVENLLVADARFTAAVNEKGRDTAGTKWDANSLFGLIDACKAEIPLRDFGAGKWDGIICDDRSGELCDFIAYRKKQPAVVFIHAKRPSTATTISAAALHDVLAQGIKNLSTIRVGGSGLPPGIAKIWNKAWKQELRVVPRLRKAPKVAAPHVTAISELLRSASTQRHVCAVISNALKRAALIEALRKPKPTPVAVQAFLQFTVFFAEVSSVGAIPTVICD